jgi:allantoinase
MPLNSLPPTVDVASMRSECEAARGRVHVDTGFWGGAIPGNSGELRALHEAGVFGFKCFLAHSGVDEFPPLGAAELERDLRQCRELGAMMIVHAEVADVLGRAPPARGVR